MTIWLHNHLKYTWPNGEMRYLRKCETHFECIGIPHSNTTLSILLSLPFRIYIIINGSKTTLENICQLFFDYYYTPSDNMDIIGNISRYATFLSNISNVIMTLKYIFLFGSFKIASLYVHCYMKYLLFFVQHYLLSPNVIRFLYS